MSQGSNDQGGRRRRDPRRERAVARPGSEGRIRVDRADSRQPAPAAPPPQSSQASGRNRRDPRAQRRVVAGAAGRARVSPRGTVGDGFQADASLKASAVAASIKVIDNPAYLIAVVPDLPEGRLSGHDRDLLGAARGLAEAEGGAVMVVVFADPGEDLAGAGADRVLSFAGAIFEGYAPEPRTQAVAAAVAAYQPRHLLFPDSPLGGADLGRRVAARLGERPATGAWQIALDQTTRRACGGSEELILPTPQVLLVTEEAADPVDDSRREARQVDSPPVALKARIEDLGPIAVDPENVSLAEAELILAAGNGIRDWDCFHRLAQALGAAEGGSRVVVDAGFLPRQRQVGATGTLVTARCYVAFGISGASQHLQGISRCEQVVAVNVDPSCNMVKRADLAVIGDVQAIMPELLRLVQGEKP